MIFLNLMTVTAIFVNSVLWRDPGRDGIVGVLADKGKGGIRKGVAPTTISGGDTLVALAPSLPLPLKTKEHDGHDGTNVSVATPLSNENTTWVTFAKMVKTEIATLLEGAVASTWVISVTKGGDSPADDGGGETLVVEPFSILGDPPSFRHIDDKHLEDIRGRNKLLGVGIELIRTRDVNMGFSDPVSHTLGMGVDEKGKAGYTFREPISALFLNNSITKTKKKEEKIDALFENDENGVTNLNLVRDGSDFMADAEEEISEDAFDEVYHVSCLMSTENSGCKNDGREGVMKPCSILGDLPFIDAISNEISEDIGMTKDLLDGGICLLAYDVDTELPDSVPHYLSMKSSSSDDFFNLSVSIDDTTLLALCLIIVFALMIQSKRVESSIRMNAMISRSKMRSQQMAFRFPFKIPFPVLCICVIYGVSSHAALSEDPTDQVSEESAGVEKVPLYSKDSKQLMDKMTGSMERNLDQAGGGNLFFSETLLPGLLQAATKSYCMFASSRIYNADYCDSSDASQIFFWKESTKTIEQNGLCLQHDEASTSSVSMSSCNYGSDNQIWYYNLQTKQLKTRLDESRCLWYNPRRTYYALRMALCDEGEDQKFDVPSEWLVSIVGTNTPTMQPTNRPTVHNDLVSNSYRVISTSTEYCMHAASTQVVYALVCDSSRSEQVFDYDAYTGAFKQNGLCLDFDTEFLNRMIMVACNGGDNQKWHYNFQTGEFKTRYNDGMCLDVSSTLSMKPCDGGEDQKFVVPGATAAPTSTPTSKPTVINHLSSGNNQIASYDGKCIYARSDNTLRWISCSRGSESQTFSYDLSTANFQQNGLCLSYGTNTHVTLAICDNELNKKWRYNANTKELKTMHDDSCLDSLLTTPRLVSCNRLDWQKIDVTEATSKPTSWPTAPTPEPTTKPTAVPTRRPTMRPTFYPTPRPSLAPSKTPTNRPTTVNVPSAEKVRVVSNPDLCMVANPNGNNVYLHNCDPNSLDQLFYYDAATQRILHDDLCLDYDPGSKNVYMGTCHNGLNQMWQYFSESKTLKTLMKDGHCLDWGNENLYMFPCHGETNQQFQIPSPWLPSIVAVNIPSNEKVRVVSDIDLCMDAHPSTNNVYMVTCVSDNRNQVFQISANSRQIIHDGFCLDYDPVSANVALLACNEEDNQKWRYDEMTKVLKTLYDEKCLDWGNGNLYMQQDCHGGNNQKFEIPIMWMDALEVQGHVLNGASFINNDIIQIAEAAINIGLPLAPTAELDNFRSLDTDITREALKHGTVTSLGLASRSQFNALLDKENANFCPALLTWNESGSADVGGGKTKREQLCAQISGESSRVSADTVECMCGWEDPFIFCEMKLGKELVQFSAQRRKNVRQRRMEENKDNSRDRNLATDCNLNVETSGSIPKELNLETILSLGTQKGTTVTGTCTKTFPSYPFLSMEASASIYVPDFVHYSAEGAAEQIYNGDLIPGAEAIIQEAATTSSSISGKICLLPKELSNLKPFEDILELLGLDLCFLQAVIQIWPLREHASFRVSATALDIITLTFGLAWQFNTELRDTLQLCKNTEPDCGNIDEIYCQMDGGEVVGYFELGLWLYLIETSFVLPFGQDPYEGCDKHVDGTLCLLGTTCNACMNPATYWYGKAFTACGSEPNYPDGTICLLGTSCNQCENPATFWPDHHFTWACGEMPCWEDGTICLEGTTCASCCNTSTFWPDDRFTWACGEMPCWEEGTFCLEGTTCASCCNGSFFSFCA